MQEEKTIQEKIFIRLGVIEQRLTALEKRYAGVEGEQPHYIQDAWEKAHQALLETHRLVEEAEFAASEVHETIRQGGRRADQLHRQVNRAERQEDAVEQGVAADMPPAGQEQGRAERLDRVLDALDAVRNDMARLVDEMRTLVETWPSRTNQ